ncbi:MAG: YcxB family protein [Phycisphaerales bacterium]
MEAVPGSSPTPAASADADAPVSLAFDLTEGDLLALYRAAGDTDPLFRHQMDGLRRRYRNSLAFAILLSAAFVLGLATNTLGMASVDRPALAVVMAAALAGAWLTFDQHRRALRLILSGEQARLYVLSDAARYFLGPHRVTIGPGGASLSTRHHDITQRWSGIAEVRETADGVYIIRRDRHCFIIPKRLFASPAEADSVARRARRWLDAAGEGDAARMRALLAWNDVPCPACRYNLRGLTEPRCPECGLVLGPEVLRGLGGAR